ncbi:MAG: DUF4202 domain-containing protein [Actinobacteria bacterium]|nr:DUF4202 domain-containing protein [Actinomycetota bacterium]
MAEPGWLTPALAAIDAANAGDPTLIEVDGILRPKELVHAERMTAWLERLEAAPTPEQRLAARAHHLERWKSPRRDYPEGRAGYLRWRSAAKERHARDVSDLLGRCGVPAAVIERTATIISKRELRTDAASQMHEDCLCLTFFELQGLDTAAQLGDKATAVVYKTLDKMTDRGRGALASATLHPQVREVIAAQLAVLDAAGGAR